MKPKPEWFAAAGFALLHLLTFYTLMVAQANVARLYREMGLPDFSPATSLSLDFRVSLTVGLLILPVTIFLARRIKTGWWRLLAPIDLCFAILLVHHLLLPLGTVMYRLQSATHSNS